MHNALGLKNSFVKQASQPLLRPYAQKLAKDVLSFDQQIAQSSLQKAAKQLATNYTSEIRTTGLEYLPSRGPVLVLSNHPGLADTLALLAVLARNDLSILALDRPFLRELSYLSEKLIFVSEEKEKAVSGLRKTMRWLQAGGALLTFPAGKIEPDPYVREGSLASIETWSDSVYQLTRVVPDLQVIVVMVAGVFNSSVLKHPLTKLKKEVQNQELFAAALQIALKRYQNNLIDLAFTEAITEKYSSLAEFKLVLRSRAEDALSSLAQKHSKPIFY